MKISDFKIQNFKSFGKHEGNEDKVTGLSKVNMIYGYNNSGKSNVLKFIETVFKSKTRTQVITFETDSGEKEITKVSDSGFYTGNLDGCAFLFHKNDTSQPVEFEFTVELSNDELKKIGEQFDTLKTERLSNHPTFPLTFKGTIVSIDGFDSGRIRLHSVTLNKKAVLSLGTDGQNEFFKGAATLEGNQETFASLMGLLTQKILFLDNGRYLHSKLEQGQETEVKPLTPENYKKWLFQQYINPETYPNFEKLIAFIQENKIKAKTGDHEFFKHAEALSPLSKFNPEFSKDKKTGRYEIMLKAGSKRFPISSFGTGIHQLLFILSAIFESKARIILIEEMEMNLSPKYQKELVAILQQMISNGIIDQVFFTTHSKYFIFRSDFSIYEVSMTHEVSKITKVKPRKTLKEFFKLD